MPRWYTHVFQLLRTCARAILSLLYEVVELVVLFDALLFTIRIGMLYGTTPTGRWLLYLGLHVSAMTVALTWYIRRSR
jgi:hypothetical protein